MKLLCVDKKPIEIEKEDLILMNPFHRLLFLRTFFLVIIACLGASCTNEEKRLRKKNLKGEILYRHHDEYLFTPSPPHPCTRELYPWEENSVGGFPRITKEFFRCKGSPLNPVRSLDKGGKIQAYYQDCLGGKRHGLPLRHGKEFIYPPLIQILNYIQEKTNHRVIITTGHRCPQHNTYCDETSANWASKHMLGAEVDFYVEGIENQPEKVIALIQDFYAENYKDQKEFSTFERYEKQDLKITTPPWLNKEIFIKLYREHEGRDFDNQHSYPYIGIQMRYDQELDQKVSFDSKQAQNYLRH